MADFAGTMKEAAFATSPREFDLSYSTTLEEIFDKLNARKNRVPDAVPDQGRRRRAAHRV